MSTTPPAQSDPPASPAAGSLRATLLNAVRFWELRRLLYNLILTTVVLLWLAFTWPHFRPAFTLPSLLPFSVLALLANLCYTSAYLLDIPFQLSAFNSIWLRRRWLLWLLGTLFAILLENYWIADEIYPDFH